MNPVWPFPDRPPFEVQLEALKQACGKFGFAWFMSMGLGKTAVVLAEFVNLLASDEVDILVVVAPNPLKSNWRRETVIMGIDVPVFIWDGKKASIKYIPKVGPFVFVVNYEALLGRGFDFVKSLAEKHRTYLALDESSFIKSHKAARTKNVHILVDYMSHVRLLNGTPIANGPDDLWAQLRAIKAKGIRKYMQFKYRYCNMGGFEGRKVVGSKNEQELANLMKPYAFLATKEEWAKGLPDKLYTIHDITMTAEQKKAYSSMLNDYYAMVEDQAVTVSQKVSALMKMQQISSGFMYGEDGSTLYLVDPKSNPKINDVADTLEMIDGKMIVFANYKASIDMLRERFPTAAYFISASVAGEGYNIEEQSDRFNNDPDCEMLISQIQVGQFGHTLIGTKRHRCATVYFFENMYSLLSRKQAEDRPHRWGADRDILYVDSPASPVEERMATALAKKTDVANAVNSLIEFKPKGTVI